MGSLAFSTLGGGQGFPEAFAPQRIGALVRLLHQRGVGKLEGTFPREGVMAVRALPHGRVDHEHPVTTAVVPDVGDHVGWLATFATGWNWKFRKHDVTLGES